MSSIEKAGSGKLAKIVEGIEFENDFGQEILGLGHITQDKGVIAVGSLIGLFLGTSIVNLPLGLLVAALGLNDWIALNRMPTNRAVDTVASPVEEEDEKAEDDCPILTEGCVATPSPTVLRTPVNRPSFYQSSTVRSAYSLILENPFQSLAVFGAQRTGKSYLMAILSQELHRRGIPVYAINLARFGEEDDVYWCHCVRSVMEDISEMRPYEAKQVIEQAIDVVEEFYAQPRAILVFDEWAYAGGKNNAHAADLEPLLKSVADKLSILTSTGIKRGRAIWTISPEFVAKDLQDPALAIKKSKLLYVTIAPGKSVYWNKNKITFDEQLYSQVKRNYSIDYPEGRYSQERVCYLNKEWIEMGELPPLDPNLRGVVTATPPKTTAPAAFERPVKPSATDKQQIDAAMVQALRNTAHHTLWEFVRDELGSEDTEEIKAALEAIANLIFDNDLGTLKDKFRLQSKYDVRYSYAGYSKKVAQTHRYTGNTCSCCHKEQSKEAHHSHYLGVDDEPGINLFPLCLSCHKSAHGSENWIKDGIWASRNTAEFEMRLRLDYQYAISEEGA